MICHPTPIKGMYREDLIKAHLRSASQENFKRRGDWEAFLDDLRVELVAWHPTWLHDNEVLMYGVKNDPILIGFREIEGYSSVRVVRRFGGIQPIPLVIDFHQFTLN